MGGDVIDCMRMVDPSDVYNVRFTKLRSSPFRAAEDGISGLRYLFVHIAQKYKHLEKLLAPHLSAEAAALAKRDAEALRSSEHVEHDPPRNTTFLQTALGETP